MKIFFAGILCLIALVSITCAPSGLPPKSTGFGSILLSSNIMPPAAPPQSVLHKSAATTWDSLIITISGPLMSQIRYSFVCLSGVYITSNTFADVPAGPNRLVSAWTKNLAGDTIQGPATAVVTVEANQLAAASLTLFARCGSIYIVLTDVPTSVDSVWAVFASKSKSWRDSIRVPSSAKVTLTLDNIIYGSTGTLSIIGKGSLDDTVVRSIDTGFIFTNSNVTKQPVFTSQGSIPLSVAINQPAVTIVEGSMNPAKHFQSEDTLLPARCIISEIMFTGGSSSTTFDYVELANPTDSAFGPETLYLNIDGSSKLLAGLTIAPHGFSVIAGSAFPAEWNPGKIISIDLTATTGWLTLFRRTKNGSSYDTTVLDRVVYDNGAQNMDWPKISSSSAKTSVVLDTLLPDPFYNNYGSHWKISLSSLVYNGVTYYGTPGIAGR